MEELLEGLARALVDEPSAVKVESFEEDDGTLVLELSVGQDDYGKVIGRGGRTAVGHRAQAPEDAGHQVVAPPRKYVRDQ